MAFYIMRVNSRGEIAGSPQYELFEDAEFDRRLWGGGCIEIIEADSLEEAEIGYIMLRFANPTFSGLRIGDYADG